MKVWRRFLLPLRLTLIVLTALALRSAAEAIFAQDSAPVLETIAPDNTTPIPELVSIEVRFNKPVEGVDAADLLVNGVPATNVFQVAEQQFIFSFPPPDDGPVTIEWRAGHGIFDLDTPPHAFGGGTWNYLVDQAVAFHRVMISEFMASNQRTIRDEDGDASDWLELFNSGELAVDLTGWFLTDDPTQLAKWRFPEVELAPGAYLLVFASEKNRTNPARPLHTNFKLDEAGEYLALVSPLTNVVSEFAPVYPAQFVDVSFGRALGAPETLGYFLKPTPGAANTASGPGFSPKVTFSRRSGPALERFPLTLSTPFADAVIHYTLDGTFPTNSSPIYRSPILITNTVQVRALSMRPGLLPSLPHSETFLLLATNVQNSTSTLPVIVLSTVVKKSPTASSQTFAHFSLYEPISGFTSLTNPPTLTTRAAIKIRGSSTEGLPKSSFALEFWDEFNQDTKLSPLGLPAESDWVLYGPNQYEPVLIHNPFIHQLSREMGRYSPRTRFVEVYLNKTGGPVTAADYNGLYVLEEKIKIGNHRVAIDELKPENSAPPEVTGGYLLKTDRLDPGDSGLPGGGATIAYIDPKEREIKTPARLPQQTYIRGFFSAFNKALSGANFRDPIAGYAAYLDVQAAIDFHVLEVLSGNVDALVLSTYFHKPRNGKLTFGPHWDFDRALGSTDGRDANPRIWNTGPFFGAAWWTRLFGDKDFWQKWVDRWEELRETEFSLSHINAVIDQMVGEIREAQPRELARWKIKPRGGTYEAEVRSMKNWLSNRIDFIDRQMTARPRVSAAPGRVPTGLSVTIEANTNATIYYTTDGTDPRLAQGAISPTARVFTAPIRVDANTRIVARAHDSTKKQTGGPPTGSSTPWSGPVAATYVVSPPTLILTEIMFHPVAPPAGSTHSASDFEFLELKNQGDQAVLLPGFHFTHGIDFAFTDTNALTVLAPGQRLLLVKNRAAFLSRYPDPGNIAGEYAGSLDNNGNRLTLVGPLQELVFDLTYQDDWAKLADGFGFSLALADENTAPDELPDKKRWRLSAGLGGSPGQLDPKPGFIPPIRISEALSRPFAPQEDAVELYNPTAQTVDISGWFLTDKFRTPNSFRIPDGTQIGPQSFIVLSRAQLKSADGTRLALSALGDDIYLFSADAKGNLTGYFHGFSFSGAEPGVSFGLYQSSTGAEFFLPERQTTLGSLNAGPRIGPVVISEVMHHARKDGPFDLPINDFIELKNVTPTPVPLYDVLHPENTWQLRGTVRFDFPRGMVIPPNGFAVIVGFDPQLNQAALLAFSSRYLLQPGTLLVGPWEGDIEAGSHSIVLLKPAEPLSLNVTDASQIPETLIDQIDYSNEQPWPNNTEATGLSLQRRSSAAFGNDPANWIAAAPNPGDMDADGNGLPDEWAIRNGLLVNSLLREDSAAGDPDGDGATNLDELTAGTGPFEPQSELRIAARLSADGHPVIEFNAAPLRHYTILFRDSATNEWRVLQNIFPRSGGGSISIKDSPTNQARFYRVQTP